MNLLPVFTIALSLLQASPADTLRPAVQLPEVAVIGTTNRLRLLPGSGELIPRARLEATRPRSLNEAVRGVAGIHARDEEGLGLRANLGVRGLSPTRSGAMLLLEDGVPFSIAPYGDNGSYYTPPIARIDGIEILKGSGQIAYGPRTIGGVVNLLSPAVPTGGSLGRYGLSLGSYGLVLGQARYGTGRNGKGLLADLLFQQAGSGRANIGTTILDGTVKGTTTFGPAHRLTLKANGYRERSQVTYSGLREDEYLADPFRNPFVGDSMFMDRVSAMAEHRWLASGTVMVTTRAYGSRLSRDWWRQSSNSAERPNDATDPGCGGMANLRSTCGNQGRLRDYTVWGVEPRILAELAALGAGSQLEAGVRLHFERQDRRQENGASPNARDAGPGSNPNAGLVENNVRENQALSAFLQPRIQRGKWTVTPGLRIEQVWYQRTNELATATSPPGTTGTTSLTEVIPGLGATWNPTEAWTLFGGLHRGFAPPRTEDIITSSGGVVDLEAERSWNAEIGARARPARGLEAEATAFQLDFSNQIIPASVAGGTGALLTSAGETLHRGLELGLRLGSEVISETSWRAGVDLSWTWLPVARFASARYGYLGTGGSDVPGKVYQGQNAGSTRTKVSVEGNRLPYAPAYTLSGGITWDHPRTPAVRLEAHRTGRQFADPANTEVLAPDGQQGVIPAYTFWNLTANYRVRPLRTTVSMALKNLFDARYVVDRSRGLLPGMPRMVQVGVELGH